MLAGDAFPLIGYGNLYQSAGRSAAASAGNLDLGARQPVFYGVIEQILKDLHQFVVVALHIWQVGGILARESGVQGVLDRDADLYQLTGPDAALLSAKQDGHVASERMVIVGGEISALLLGFALVAAIGLRRGVWNESRRLSQRGARRTQR